MPTENLPSPYPNEYIDTLLRELYKLFVDNNALNEIGSDKKAIRQKVIAGIEKNNFNDSKFNAGSELLNLFKLLCFIQAWSDFDENWINDPDDADYKKHRQEMKFKKDIDKSLRKLIHLALFKAVYESLWRFKKAAEAAKNDVEIAFINELLEKLKHSSSKKILKEVIIQFLKYKEFEKCEDIEANFTQAVKLISVFSHWQDKFFYVCGIVLGVIAALTCGLSTGGAIFVLLAGLSLPLGLVIPLSVLIFLAGTRANFQLFSQHIPHFFQDLCRSGRMTEFIDQQGQRLQLSGKKKFLLLPAGLLSLSVGIAAAAIAYLEGTKMLAIICPMLLATCPHLTIAILGILASALLIGLTIVMLRTFIGVLQSQFSFEKIKQSIIEKWQKLNFIKGLGYIFKVFVMGAALFGLGYLDLTGTATLAGLLGWVAADIITLAAIIGDLPFTLITAVAWCNNLFKKNSNPNSGEPKNRIYYLYRIVEFFALIINAFGNAALVFTESFVSRIASIAAFMNSYASNRIQEDDNKLVQARVMATEKSLSSLKCTFFKPSLEVPQVSKVAINDEITYMKTVQAHH
ncbi:MAG: hypothetical protein WA659_03345 [Candidatus Aquirickettsiella sp.]